MKSHEQDSPCRGCEQRKVGCRKECQEWIDWEKEHKERRDELRRLRAWFSDLRASSSSTADKERKHHEERDHYK